MGPNLENESGKWIDLRQTRISVLEKEAQMRKDEAEEWGDSGRTESPPVGATAV